MQFEPWSTEWKREQLRLLFREWADCDKCTLAQYRTNIVFGNGNPDAEIMVIGEGPGVTEDETGEVFVGESGLLLNDILTAAGLVRDDLFITNIVKCRPPENRDPTKDEKQACDPLLTKQIYIVDPRLIICVGKQAMVTLMNGMKSDSILSEHGLLGEIIIPGRHREVRYTAMPILHPAFILRDDKINRRTRNWEVGGHAHNTMLDLIRAKEIVALLRTQYEKAAEKIEKFHTPSDKPRRRLRVVD